MDCRQNVESREPQVSLHPMTRSPDLSSEQAVGDRLSAFGQWTVLE